MGHNVTIGGQRLGSGKKMQAYLHNYERSTHDLSYVWRSTMASGTLVPFMSQVALPGDTFDIDLNVDVLTHPTVGPLFGSYKIQLDVFQIPMRLYQGKLHMNMLGIGMDMSKVALPVVSITAKGVNGALDIDNQHINPSCIFSYLGMRGLGINVSGLDIEAERKFNAIPYLSYWDIYKNYYANKQEEIGAMIHKDTAPYTPVITAQTMTNVYNATTGVIGNFAVPLAKPADPVPYTRLIATAGTTMVLNVPAGLNTALFDPAAVLVYVFYGNPTDPTKTPTPVPADELFDIWDIQPTAGIVTGTIRNRTNWPDNGLYVGWAVYVPSQADKQDTEPKVVTFPLENIDTMRRNILAHLSDAAYVISTASQPPYGLPFRTTGSGAAKDWSQLYSQEGLALKTYQSDLFNNWISTEWIDGADGISEITAVDVSGGSLKIDELNMSKKIYDMLNRIAISGGSYDDWLDAVYTHERSRSAENPMYLGGLIRNLVFQEVVSQSTTPGEPLGTLAGRGRVGGKNKGGHIVAKIDEPSYLMGIISLTPHIDYSQGNTWDTNLLTLNDLHKPALDEIGFQDLVTDQMAWFNTSLDPGLSAVPLFKSAGKQPAWVNYMTNVNKVLGNFADQTQQMFMVLNRRYEPRYTTTGMQGAAIADLTTYIDPTKFNHIFADTRRDAQNFWAQIGVNIEARRKMSAKIMPNL